MKQLNNHNLLRFKNICQWKQLEILCVYVRQEIIITTCINFNFIELEVLKWRNEIKAHAYLFEVKRKKILRNFHISTIF